ncbi:hypothetical protein JOC86_002342 [Bacillus pakistanensis]|uniref:Lipoprotein n=1 Tax=Rossellomorea pakistanensis TaxID=992288 RepID=A0ABS2ND69_9BACI|nr:hypothetical protein [Bacillus pakistanensis]MBM7585800.1 hypothetical protein [Bacillus pakistanensis]
MKKLFLFIFTLSLFLLGACTSEESKKENPDSKEKASSEEVETESTEESDSKYPFPENAQPVGDASILVSTPAGDSSNGNVPVLFVNEDDMLIQIGLDAENFQGDKETFIYINKKFLTTDQFGEMNQTSLDLQEELLDPGEYTVTAVQFEGNDPAKMPVTFVEAKYKIEEKS